MHPSQPLQLRIYSFALKLCNFSPFLPSTSRTSSLSVFDLPSSQILTYGPNTHDVIFSPRRTEVRQADWKEVIAYEI